MADSSSLPPRPPTPSEAPTIATPRRASSPDPCAGPLSPGRMFGRYKVVRLIGQGGMGEVYEVQQDQPRRNVALKIIRTAFLSPQLLRRFEHESHVLGRLQHPGIAQIYEAGAARDGHGETTPFFAMELIKGVPLTEFADAERLGARQRLELIARIADAIDHAHQKGVIHRDLKPGNILVDETGQPKILDFGVARATDSDLQQATMQTDVGQLIGTVPYMSPEQVGGNPDELDTRSDVYALGIVAYELLAGRLPYDLRRKMIHEAARIIREEDPARLSSINRTLRGDVETIVAKALEKDKARRYQTAEALSSDIRRYLRDEPIAARPASTWYQLSKFNRRNRGLVSGIAAAFVLLIAGIIGTSLALGRALTAESDLTRQLGETDKARRAESAERERADVQRDAAVRAQAAEAEERRLAVEAQRAEAEARHLADEQRDLAIRARESEAEARRLADSQRDRAVAAEAETARRADELEEVATFQGNMLRKINPMSAGKFLIADLVARFIEAQARLGAVKPDSTRVAERREFEEQLKKVNATDAARDFIDRNILRPAAKAVDRRFKDQPAVDAQLRQVLADRYRELGMFDEAAPLQESALATRRRILGENHPKTRISLRSMGDLLQAQGKFDEAAACYREILGKRTPGRRGSIGYLRAETAQGTQTEARLRARLDEARASHIEGNAATLKATDQLASLLESQGRDAEAEALYRETIMSARRARGPASPELTRLISGLGILLLDQDKLDEAEPLLREALDGSRTSFGEKHPDTLIAIINMGSLLEARGRHDEVVKLLSGAEPAARETFTGDNAPTLAALLISLGKARGTQLQLAPAETSLLEAHALLTSALGESHEQTRQCAQCLVDFYNAAHAAQRSRGYAAKAAKWRAKADPPSLSDPDDPPSSP